MLNRDKEITLIIDYDDENKQYADYLFEKKILLWLVGQ